MGRDQRISANRAPGPDDPEEPAPVSGVAPRTDASLGPGSGPPIVPPGLARPVEFDDPTGIISDRASDRPTSLIPPRTSRRPRSPSSDPPLLRSLGPPRPAPALTDNPSVQAAIAADLDDSLRAMVEERSQSRPFSLPAAPVTVDNLFDEGTAASGEFHAPPPAPVPADLPPQLGASGTRPTSAARVAFLADDPSLEEADRERRRFPQEFIHAAEETPGRPAPRPRAPRWLIVVVAVALFAAALLWRQRVASRAPATTQPAPAASPS